MNTRFTNYLQSLTPKKRDIAKEAIQEYLKGESEDIQVINTEQKAFVYCQDLQLEEVEHAEVLLLRNNCKLIKRVKIAQGGLTETLFDVRLIMKEALFNNATAIIMVHNHPSGSNRPSMMDDQLTMSVKKACDIMRISLADHIIVADDYYSYREQGKI
jgi:DNA repair protein RadC